MRTLALTLATVAAALAGASVTAQAGTALGAEALRAAAADLQLVDKVHCRPGRWHHRSSGDGCRRAVRYHYQQPYHSYGYSPYAYGYGPYAYGYSPGISFHFGSGHRRGHRGW